VLRRRKALGVAGVLEVPVVAVVALVAARGCADVVRAGVLVVSRGAVVFGVAAICAFEAESPKAATLEDALGAVFVALAWLELALVSVGVAARLGSVPSSLCSIT
jgi:hypothetical protein